MKHWTWEEWAFLIVAMIVIVLMFVVQVMDRQLAEASPPTERIGERDAGYRAVRHVFHYVYEVNGWMMQVDGVEYDHGVICFFAVTHGRQPSPLNCR